MTEQTKTLLKEETYQTFSCDVTLADETTLTISATDVVQGSVVIDKAATSTNELELGSCIASEFSMELYNNNNQYNGVDFSNALLVPKITVGTTTITLGKFYVDNSPKVRGTVSISALDKMLAFDIELTETDITELFGNEVYVYTLVQRLCNKCGITLASSVYSRPNARKKVKAPEDLVGETFRKLLMWCCQLLGGCGTINAEGNFEFIPLNKTVTLAETITEGMRFASDYEDYEIEITGVLFDDDDGRTITGTDTYAFDLSDNPLCQDASTMIPALNGIVGLKYTPCSMLAVPMPYLNLLNWVGYSVNEVVKNCLVTSINFVVNGRTTLISSGARDKQSTSGSISKILQKRDEVISRQMADVLTEAKADASTLINNSLGGYVVIKDTNNDGHPDEILIMDTDDVATATKVWRWNSNGLGYSSTGYSGTYSTAITSDGQIVADFIKSGTLSADLLGAGTISSADGENTWNLSSGDFQLRKGVIKISGSTDMGGDPNYIMLVENISSSRNFSAQYFGSMVDLRLSDSDTETQNTMRLQYNGIQLIDRVDGQDTIKFVDLPYTEVSGGSELSSTGAYRYRKWQNGKIELWSRRFVQLKFDGTWGNLKNASITSKTSVDGDRNIRFAFPDGLFNSDAIPRCWVDVSNSVNSDPCWIVHAGQGSQSQTDSLFPISATANNTSGAIYVDLYAVQH